MIKRLVFIGSSAFALPSLQLLLEYKDHTPLMVITQPPRPKGRKLQPEHTHIGLYATQKGIPFIYPDDINDWETIKLMSDLKPDLLVTVSYGALIRRCLRLCAKYGAINLHPSILPHLRGATPIQTAILQGMSRTGITIFRLNSRMDAGAIYRQQRFSISADENYSSLHNRLAVAGADMLVDFIRKFNPNTDEPIPQDETQATYSHKVGKSDFLIDWTQPAAQVVNRIRAFSHEPGAYQIFRAKTLKIIKAKVMPVGAQGSPGSIQQIIKNTGWSVNCSDHQVLITSVQPAGKAIMSAWSFHLGARIDIGELISDTAIQVKVTEESDPLKRKQGNET